MKLGCEVIARSDHGRCGGEVGVMLYAHCRVNTWSWHCRILTQHPRQENAMTVCCGNRRNKCFKEPRDEDACVHFGLFESVWAEDGAVLGEPVFTSPRAKKH